MKRLLYILLFIPLICSAQESVLSDFFQKLEQNTLESRFSFTMQQNASQPLTYNGTVVMRGEQFRIQLMGMDIAYDGKTLYNYSEDTNELTLSHPTEEELTEANPLLYAKALAGNCQVKTRDRGNQWQLVLTPLNQQTGVKNFTLNLRKTDLLPLSAQMKETASKTTTLKFLDARYTEGKPSFIIEAADAYLNDLR